MGKVCAFKVHVKRLADSASCLLACEANVLGLLWSDSGVKPRECRHHSIGAAGRSFILPAINSRSAAIALGGRERPNLAMPL